jgi:hypothetical protein
MNKTKIIIIALIVAIVASNGWWAYRLLDAGITLTYTGVSLIRTPGSLGSGIGNSVFAIGGVIHKKVGPLQMRSSECGLRDIQEYNIGHGAKCIAHS